MKPLYSRKNMILFHQVVQNICNSELKGKNDNTKQNSLSQDVIDRKVSSERLRRYLSGEADDSVRLFFSKLQRERGGIGEDLLIFFDVRESFHG